MSGISLKGMISLDFLKKERFTGSHGKMRYMLCMEEGRIKAAVYPGPYCWESTPEEQKTSETFDGTKEGLEEAVTWLNQRYDSEY